MKSVGHCAMTLLLTLGISSCRKTGDARPEGPDAGWQSFASPEGGFSVLMPGKPTCEAVAVPRAYHPAVPEKSVQSTACSYEDAGIPAFYSDAWWDYPDQAHADEGVLDHVVDYVMSNKEVEWKKEISMDGNPGREFRGTYSSEGHTAVVQFRFYLVKGRIYQFGVFGNKKAFAPGKVDKFLDSFKLIQPHS